MPDSAPTEKLSASSKIVLFGRVVEDLEFKPGTGDETVTHEETPQLARIYGFSYDGAYFEMLTPVLFMVKTKGEPAEYVRVPGPNPRDKEFFDSLWAWTVDRREETFRLDVEAGKFENLLLDPSGESGMGLSGTRVAGAKVAGAKVSGAKVSGAKVSGARISGARGDASD